MAKSRPQPPIAAPAQNYEAKILPMESVTVPAAPYYRPISDEVETVEQVFRARGHVALLGPTGFGKGRFAEYMAWRIGEEVRKDADRKFPYIRIMCTEDMSEAHLVGQFFPDQGWIPGPAYAWATGGGMLFVDELAKARGEIITVLYPVADERALMVNRKRERIALPDDAMLFAGWNPGYQGREPDPSTRQRFMATIYFGPPDVATEAEIIAGETRIDAKTATTLAEIAASLRTAKTAGKLPLQEIPSTRVLVHAAKLIQQGSSPQRACTYAIANALTNERGLQGGIAEIVARHFP